MKIFNLKIIFILSAISLLSACSSTSGGLVFYGNGTYYAGDEGCEQHRQATKNKIACFNSNGKGTGHRTAMSKREVDIYFQSRMSAMRSKQALTASMNDLADSISNMKTRPPVQMNYPSSYNGYQNTRLKTGCIRTGNTMSCNTRESGPNADPTYRGQTNCIKAGNTVTCRSR
jgi:hypothetical protein